MGWLKLKDCYVQFTVLTCSEKQNVWLTQTRIQELINRSEFLIRLVEHQLKRTILKRIWQIRKDNALGGDMLEKCFDGMSKVL